ncbi:MAG: radical SAM protein [Cycloclasticus sp.]|nr:radical SAM protein [Cycloclasticus sp. 46_83_sub15_T18]
MNYSYPLFRPPSEAHSIILQITEGCSFNRCSFCSMYREKDFAEKPLTQVLSEIKQMANAQPQTRRVFLADGDALVRDTASLVSILEALYQHFPALERVSSYALPSNLLNKSTEQLTSLRKAGLKLLYYGLETGCAELLKCITKGATPKLIKTGLDKARTSGMEVSATIILGLGGQHYWQQHIEQTAKLVNELQLNYLSTLQLKLDPSIEEEFLAKFKRQGKTYAPQNDNQLLQEQALLIALVSPQKSLTFRSNHASNALPLKGELPRDKTFLLNQLQLAAAGDIQLVPKWLRGL